jgi:hypothetical protein
MKHLLKMIFCRSHEDIRNQNARDEDHDKGENGK